MSLLFELVTAGDLDGIARLLDREPEAVRALDERGQTPLHVAAEHGRVDVVRLLLDRGAPVDGVDEDDETPPCCVRGEASVELASLLVARGADPAAISRYMWRTPLWGALVHREEALARYLLSLGVPCDHVLDDFEEHTPLTLALEVNEPGIARLLLARAVDVRATDAHGRSALHYARMHGHADLAEVLLARGADPYERDMDGKTPGDYADEREAAEARRAGAPVRAEGGDPE